MASGLNSIDSFQPSCSNRRYRLDGLRFPVLFSILLLAAFLSGYFLPYRIDLILREITCTGAVLLAKGLGLISFAEPGNIISIEGRELSIISECTAINYMLIFAAAVVAYPAALKKKAFGLLIGVPAIVFINLSRIVFLGWIGGHYPLYFKPVHDYLWEGGFLLAVMLIWVGWVNSRFLVSGFQFSEGLKTKNLKLKTVLLLASIVIAYFFSDVYLRTLANASTRLIDALGIGGGVIRYNGKGLFIILWGQEPWKVSSGIYCLLPFMLLTLLAYLSGRARVLSGFSALTPLPLVKRAITWVLLFMSIQIFAVVVTYMALLIQYP